MAGIESVNPGEHGLPAGGRAAVALPHLHFAVLLRSRALQLRNAVDQQLRDSPVRAFTVLVLLLVIWAALYWLLKIVLQQVGRWELVAVVANQHIFVQFFLVLAVMLAFSNAILAYGSLFGRHEAGFLLALPVPARQAVTLKWLEGMVLSSWSFLLLGVPLMLAVARTSSVHWYYYPLFAAHFLGFAVLPSTLGLLVAWAVAMWAPRRPLAVLLWCGGIVLAAATLWGWSLMRDADNDRWLSTFYSQLSLARQPLLPSTWSARGIVSAIEQRGSESLLYLAATLANGAFLAWLTINLLGHSWGEAFSRAHQGRSRATVRRGGWVTAAACDVLFFYLPARLRMMMLKDLRGFVRDAPQWTQIVIMLGLLVIYAVKLQAVNLHWLPLDLGGPQMRGLLAFLNLLTISLILATFTSRFVFPLLSLESQQLWLLGLLPARRSTVLLVKFIFSLTVTGVSGLLVMGLAVLALELPGDWAGLQIVVCLATCIGLSGLAVGLGARFPVLGQRNPARIAAGFGGTFNLIASMLYVGVQMLCLVLASTRSLGGAAHLSDSLHIPVWLGPVLFVYSVAVAGVSLWVGVRHFERLEY